MSNVQIIFDTITARYEEQLSPYYAAAPPLGRCRD